MDKTISLRHLLHQNAELAFQEHETVKILKNYIQPSAPDQIIENIAGTGIAFVFKGKKNKPRILFRADLDALPISELNQFSYKSCHQNVSHKCGHDGHIAMVAAIAPLLNQIQNRGDVILFFQPAEEIGLGAKETLKDNKLQNLKIDYVFALHNIPNRELGTILYKNDTFACGSTGLKIKVTGHSSHASEPHLAKSPYQPMVQVLQKIEELNSPEFNQNYFICTITYLKLGEKSFGITPGEMEVYLTLRAQEQFILDTNLQSIQKLLTDHLSDFSLSLQEQDTFPSTTSSDQAIGYLRTAASNLQLKTEQLEHPFKWSEDFGHFTQKYQGAYFGLGSGPSKPLHHPEYDFNDELIPIGQNIFTELIKVINL